MELNTTKLMFIMAFAVIFLFAIILLRPFSLHRKYPFSTFFLKFTYLIYLLAALSITFMFMFNYAHSVSFFEDINNPRASTHFTLLMITLVVPSAGIFLRRKFKNREAYNNIFTIVNIACILYYVLLIKIAFKIAI
jgi:hypothetical protein